MTTAEKLLEEARALPEAQLREVLDFVGYLKSRLDQPDVGHVIYGHYRSKP